LQPFLLAYFEADLSF